MDTNDNNFGILGEDRTTESRNLFLMRIVSKDHSLVPGDRQTTRDCNLSNNQVIEGGMLLRLVVCR